MSFGSMLGMNFINKGIDQFTYGVGQEYTRSHAKRARGWQIEDNKMKFTQDFQQRMKMAEKYGLHPLVLAGGAGVSSSSPIIGRGPQPPSGGNANPFKPSLSPEEKRIVNANARKAEAEAGIMEKELANMGQDGAGKVGPNGGLGPAGQTDGDIYMNKNVGFADEYVVDSEGYSYIKPTQSYEQAFGEEGVLINRWIYNTRKAWYPKKVRDLRKNWNSPDQQEFKRQFIGTRPYDPQGKWTFLWSGIQWKRVPMTRKNRDHLFMGKNPYPIMKPLGRKKWYGKKDRYSDVPMS